MSVAWGSWQAVRAAERQLRKAQRAHRDVLVMRGCLAEQVVSFARNVRQMLNVPPHEKVPDVAKELRDEASRILNYAESEHAFISKVIAKSADNVRRAAAWLAKVQAARWNALSRREDAAVEDMTHEELGRALRSRMVNGKPTPRGEWGRWREAALLETERRRSTRKARRGIRTEAARG